MAAALLVSCRSSCAPADAGASVTCSLIAEADRMVCFGLARLKLAGRKWQRRTCSTGDTKLSLQAGAT